ncbi:MAG TPA: ABC transporter ATP-binding protein [Acidimicrobiales bacterium]|nr:ABC transporter ATP-binding protein [Acidimicrobiales bacterium]
MTNAEGARPLAIELRDIVKRFPGVVANDGVNLRVEAGTIHAIVGENGAGKSTLMKTLYGAQRPDEGTILVNGVERQFHSTRDAINAGIGMVFQHFMLADNLTVWENVVLGEEPGNQLRLDIKLARRQIGDLTKLFGLDVSPDQLVGDLGVGERQRVEILKVLYRGARIIILDEPTAVLVPQEVNELFAALRELTAQGSTVIFISHKLDEVLAVADAITVIRAGRTVAEIEDVSSVTARDLAELMVGSELPTPETRVSTVTDRVAFEVEGLKVVDEDDRVLVDDVWFTVHYGEILGIAGVEGNGQSELVRALVGIEPLAAGRILIEGHDATHQRTRLRRAHGLGYIPEDRQRDGLVLSAPLWENVALGHQSQPPAGRGLWIDRSGAKRRTEEIIENFDVRTPGPDVAAYALSGGNQQKLIIGREMMAQPHVLIASHPTRGIDVGAQAAVWEVIKRARRDGLAVVLVSADLDELIGLSDTLLVMYRGRVVATLDPGRVTPAELGSYMTGAHEAATA